MGILGFLWLEFYSKEIIMGVIYKITKNDFILILVNNNTYQFSQCAFKQLSNADFKSHNIMIS